LNRATARPKRAKDEHGPSDDRDDRVGDDIDDDANAASPLLILTPFFIHLRLEIVAATDC